MAEYKVDVKNELQPKCVGCPCYEEEITTIGNGMGGVVTVIVDCEHKGLCGRLEEHLKEVITDG